MENVRFLLEEANKLINRADHLLYITYPLVKDNKIIINIAENINSGVITAMEALLAYDKLYKRIPPYSNDFTIKFEMFKSKVVPRYNIEREYVVLISDLKNFMDNRKKSGTEFVKEDKFVIFRQNKVDTLSFDKIKQNLNSSKGFLSRVNRILGNVRARF
ncbi:hypothetical protein J4425_01265 [Candidatus Woesearchaeota archaeon]|nr:hypothetical protein [Candidatus Woesearchaeota archaeon]